MADKSGIEWTDATWNVLTGCSVKSPGEPGGDVSKVKDPVRSRVMAAADRAEAAAKAKREAKADA